MRAFYWKWFVTAFRHSYGVADWISGFLGLAMPPLTRVANLRDSFLDLAWEIPLGAFGLLAAFRLIMAPYWIYCEQKARIEQLQPQHPVRKPRLEIFFDPITHKQVGNINDALYRVGVRLVDSGSISRMECKLATIESLDNSEEHFRRRLFTMRDGWLAKKHDRAPWKQEHPLDQGSVIEFDLIKELRDNSWSICFGFKDPPDPQIPKGTYRLAVLATGSHVESDSKVFQASEDSQGGLSLKELS